MPPSVLLLPLFLCIAQLLLLPCLALDFLFNSFTAAQNATQLLLINDARIDSSFVKLTNDSNQFSSGRFFHASRIAMTSGTNSSSVASFSTEFVFSVLPQIPTSPGFGLAFVLSNWTSPPGALASQYFGLFTNATVPTVAPLLAVEFDTGRNPEFNDPDDNHVGIDLNNIESEVKHSAGYYNSSGGFVPLRMRNGQNVHTWIEFSGTNLEINVTIAPVGMPKPSRPLINYRDPKIANYVSPEMYVGFSASKTTWVETRRVLAWSLSDSGAARGINTSNLPVFLPKSSSSSLSAAAVAGIAIGCVIIVIMCAFGCYWYWWTKKKKEEEEEEDVVEEWELYWPHRFSYEELAEAIGGFSEEKLLGSGGFGKVYRGSLKNKSEIAVKCVNHDSKQGLREFMAEISSMGRLQHKNLVQMRGWCRKRNELLLVYDYMPNGSLNRWIFDEPGKVMKWEQRKRVLVDIVEGLTYLHSGWDQVVVHRDIKSSNVLLDWDMRARLGDFGLAKLYQHGEVPNTTRVVGTFGYLAPELAMASAPSTASDVYSFGVVVLEVVCGRRPIEMTSPEEEVVLIDWVRELYLEGKLWEAADKRMDEQEEEECIRRREEMEKALKLGLACCHPDPQRRPQMKDVLSVLVSEDDEAAPADPASALPTL